MIRIAAIRVTCMSDLRHIHDPVLSSLKMEGICFFFFFYIISDYFIYAAHSPFFSSKCRLFHNATFFGSRIIHTLHTERAKI
jgi:hypothetical protein